ncbi:hypothetical protein FBQ48_04495 [Escherichia coli]|nr:hypothetical protein [Escherichia coli]EFC0011180.1 hypothetical protein [Escherichia coli]EFC1978465.1 hypothetical protein [Escherichia coli]EFF5685171.1 hypothetical protein [Escherichia coli]EFN4452867.1 hypothetical protein [Escherichia coli]
MKDSLLKCAMWFVGMIRRASVASGIVHRTADAAKTPYPPYGMSVFCRHDKTRQRRIRHCAQNGGCGENALSAIRNECIL